MPRAEDDVIETTAQAVMSERTLRAAARLIASGQSPSRPAPPDWEQQLAEKDALIAALTDQLERAAEQLDRLKRSGADRRGGTAGGSFGVSDEQKKFLDDLQRAVQQWEDMQAALTLGRLEIQVSELRDFVASRLDNVTERSAPRSIASVHEVHREPPALPAPEPPRIALPSPVTAPPPASQQSEWERLKSQLLQHEEPQPVVVSPWAIMEQPLPEPPPACETTTADRETLVRAVETRDDYIASLMTRLRRVEALQPAEVLASVDPSTGEFGDKIKSLEQRLLDHLRTAEVELSVQRARMARERLQLQQQQEVVDRQLKKLGVASVQEVEPQAVNPANMQERRWARFLGRKD